MLHFRNVNKDGYDFKELSKSSPNLNEFIKEGQTLDFSNHEAVKTLNQAILKHHYGISTWDIPDGYLIPPVPGRADYVHYLADMLGNPKKVKCLDIGSGANCIYPIIASTVYNWEVVGSEIDPKAVKIAKAIVNINKNLLDKVEIRLQTNSENFFESIVKSNEHFDVSMCNPPFHASELEAKSVGLKKFNNLNRTKQTEIDPNFQGQANELWCKGGEERFIRKMILESIEYKENIKWFTTLVSKKGHLFNIYKTLKKAGAKDVKTIEMAQGNKKSRFVAWTF